MSSSATERAGGALRIRLQAEQRKLEAIRELSRALGATLDLDRLLVLLLDKVTELLGAERATLFLVSEQGDELRSTVMQGTKEAPIRLRMGEGIAGWVASTGNTVNIPDAYADPRFNREIDQRTGFRTRSILCMPMPNHQGRIVGVVQALNKRERPFDDDDVALLGAVAAHSAIAIENSKLYESVVSKNSELLAAQDQLRRRVEELDLLVDIQQELSTSLGLDELLDRVLGRAVKVVECEAGSVLLRERDASQLHFRTSVGGSAEVKRLTLPVGQGIGGWVALHRTAAIVNDPTHDARHDVALAEKLGFPARHILAVPLTTVNEEGETEALGAIELLNRPMRHGFDESDLKLLTLVAGQAARAIYVARAKDDRAKQERLAAIGQLLSGVVHDLKTPMTIVCGYAQLLAETDDATTRTEFSDLILKQVDRMAAMTKEVLAFARGESNLLMRKVLLNKFVGEVTEYLEREFAGKKIELKIDARYGGVAHFDELKFHRVVHNIGRNAMQAMPGGGKFQITIDARDGWLCFDFADTGRGIPAELEGRLFQLFATSGKQDGTGLGLAIVKKFVEEHGGDVSYTSAAGQGTTFHIRLPLKKE